MSNELSLQEISRAWRLLTQSEKALVGALLRRGSPLPLPANWLDKALVSPLEDSGMGSLLFRPDNSSCEQRRVICQYSEIRFRDLDGIEVSASLNLDEQMQPFELDVWKTDFSPLIAIPAVLDC